MQCVSLRTRGVDWNPQLSHKAFDDGRWLFTYPGAIDTVVYPPKCIHCLVDHLLDTGWIRHIY